MKALVVLALFCSALAFPAWAQGAPSLAPEVDSLLHALHLSERDFLSDRIWAEDDTFLLPAIRSALQTPQSAYRISRAFAETVPRTLENAPSVLDMARFIEAKCHDSARDSIIHELTNAQQDLRYFEPVITAFRLAEVHRARAFARLDSAQQQALLLAAPLWFEDEEIAADDTLKGALHRAFGVPVDTTQKVDADSVLTLLSLVNRSELTAAAFAFLHGLAISLPRWREPFPEQSPTSCDGVEGKVLAQANTPFGRFVIGGAGPNTYHGDFALIVDIGGNDTYFSRAGGAVGYLGRTLSAVVDLAGHDNYFCNAAVAQGAAVLGIGVLVDVSGDDVYRAGAFAQGSAFCGAGFLFDYSGNDIYRAGLFSQASAVCGLAVISDESGSDMYHVAEYGQGCSSTFAAAALLDATGDDTYRAGGLVFHVPLRPEDYRSFAQGFSIGWRPRAGGGFALLHDRAGNDFYDAEIYAQGVGYWYSLGALLDDGGNDSYNASQYAQGAGIHLAAGVLEDCAGDDRYASRFGPGQGGAHDLSVGFLYDHAGDDQYLMSGGQGMAITNSAALFFDRLGNDTYCTLETDLGQGGVREARGFGSLGLFLDAEGRDFYPDPGKADSLLWLRDVYGIGADLARDSVTAREADVKVTLQPTDTLRPIEEVFRDASAWAVTDNRERVKRAQLALAALGVRAVHWVGENKLGTLKSLERRAIVELFKAFPDSAAPFLLAALDSKEPARRRNAVSILGELKYRPAAAPLLQKLHDPDYARLRPSILFALGDIGDTATADALVQFSQSAAERERIAATVSLGKLGRGYEALVASLDDSAYTVRSAAVIALGSQGPDVLPYLAQALTRLEGRRAEGALLAAARLGAKWTKTDTLRASVPKLAPLVRKGLKAENPRICAAALSAAETVLSARELHQWTARLAQVQDPVLKGQLHRIQTKTRKVN